MAPFIVGICRGACSDLPSQGNLLIPTFEPVPPCSIANARTAATLATDLKSSQFVLDTAKPTEHVFHYSSSWQL